MEMRRGKLSEVEKSQRRLFLETLQRAFEDTSRNEITLKDHDGNLHVITRQEANLYLAAGSVQGSPAQRLLARERVKRLRTMVASARELAAVESAA